MKKLLCSMISLLMIFSSLTHVQVVQAKEDESLQEVSASIYPKPQSMTSISKEGMKLDGTVDIVVHGQQDDATLPKLKEILENQGIAYQVVDEVGTNATIVLAVKCDKDDCSYCTHVDDKENALNHGQGYVLKTSDEDNKNGQVTIVGKDEDGVYYGVMSLLQILKQKTSEGKIAEVSISDYPDVEFRGYVEGFYGIPWTFEDRASLFEDTSLYKMTTYIYAPKDDPYHRGLWRELYPEKEAENIKSLAKVAEENNMDFCWTIHPGADYNYTEDSDGNGIVDDYEKIIAKFEQVYSLGVRQFGIFYDDLDYSVANGKRHANVINSAYEYLTSKYDDIKPFITVVTRYTNSWGADWNTYFKPFMQDIHEDTIVLWTGNSTMSAITKDYMEYPQTMTGIDKDLGVWWNFPVTDYYYGHLLMGSLDCLSPEVDNINSFFLNPMSEADASKVAIYSGADYSWNTHDFNSTESWKRAIKELVPEANEEFERFADNLAYNDQGSGFFFDESKYLKEELEAFDDALAKGLTKEDVASLKVRFGQMVSDAKVLRKINNKALLEEIEQHLNAYEALGNAGIAAMEAFEYALDGEVSQTISHINSIDKYLEECDSYKIKTLSGSAKTIVGAYRIRPFIENISEDTIYSILNNHLYSSIKERMITNMDIDKKDVSYQSKTYSLKDIQVTMNKDDYIGIALPKVMNIYQISANINTLAVVVQYSLNGIEWKNLTTTQNNSILSTNDIVTGAYVRLISLYDDIYVNLKDLSVLEAYEVTYPTVSTDMPVYQDYTISKALDGLMDTNFWSSSGSKDGQYICVDLKEKAKLNTVELYSGINKHGVVDGYVKTQLEVSDDGSTWLKVGEAKEISEYQDVDSTMKKLVFDAEGVETRYFRFSAIGSSDSWAKVYEIKYDAQYVDYVDRTKVETNLNIYSTYNPNYAMDDDLSTYAWIYHQNDLGTTIGDYIQVDLGTFVPLYDASIYFGKNTKEPHLKTDGFKMTALQVSTDGKTWEYVGKQISMDHYSEIDDCYVANFKADGSLVRYIRFVAGEDYKSWAKVYEIKYNESLNLNSVTGTVKTNMKTYQSYNIGNALDGKLDTKFYSSDSSKVGDYIQVDFGNIYTVFDTSIYFGGDPNKAGAIDGFAAMNIQVSIDGSEWKNVGSMVSNEYKVVGGKYLASLSFTGVEARYIRFIATKASSSWLQAYEIEFNKTVDTNNLRYVDDLSTVNINYSHLIDDRQLQTNPYIYNVEANDTLIYPTNVITHVASLGILQNEEVICHAKVSIQERDGQWIEIGTLDKAWNEFDINKQILAIKLTFDGKVQPVIYEMLLNSMKPDYSKVDEAIAKVPTDLSIYTDETVKVLNEALENVKRGLFVDEQERINVYASAIEDAINALQLKQADYSKVEEAKAKVPTDLSKYTDESIKALEEALKAVVEGLDITKQEEVNAFALAIEEAIVNLEEKEVEIIPDNPNHDNQQKPTVDDQIKTGDQSNIMLYVVVGIVAIVGFVFLIKKKNNE